MVLPHLSSANHVDGFKTCLDPYPFFNQLIPFALYILIDPGMERGH